MNIDELQQKFNEMRRKRWRKKGTRKLVTISGFVEEANGACFILAEIDGVTIFVYPSSLEIRYCGGEYIEEVNLYEYWPKNARAWFWDEGSRDKLRGHFAGVNASGKPMSWPDGCTSWTADQYRGPSSWDHAELAEDGK